MATSTTFAQVVQRVNTHLNAGDYTDAIIELEPGTYGADQCNTQFETTSIHPLSTVTFKSKGGKITFNCQADGVTPFMRIQGTSAHKINVNFHFVEGSELEVTGAVSLLVGGALSVQSAILDLQYCNFNRNKAGVYGGVISLDNHASAKFTHCMLAKNGANKGGGVAYVSTGSSVEFDSSTLAHNYVDNLNADGGGVVYFKANDTAAVFTKSTIANNTAGNENKGGGVLYFTDEGATARFEDCEVTGNSAGTDAKRGGGVVYFNVNDQKQIATRSSSVTFLDSKVTANTVPSSATGTQLEAQGGGVAFMERGTGILIFKDTVVSENLANTTWGGGVALVGLPGDKDINAIGQIEFTGTTKVESNEAEFGGVVLTMHPDVRIISATTVSITGNTAEKNGGMMAVMAAIPPATLLGDFKSTAINNNRAVAENGGDLIWWAYPSSCFSPHVRDTLLAKLSPSSSYAATSAFASGPKNLDCAEVTGDPVPAGENFPSTWVLRDCYGSEVSVLNSLGTFVFNFNTSKGCTATPSQFRWENDIGGTVVQDTTITRTNADDDCTLSVILQPPNRNPHSSPPLTMLPGFDNAEDFKIPAQKFDCVMDGDSMDAKGNCGVATLSIGIVVALAVLGAVIVIMFGLSVRTYIKRRRARAREEYTNFDVELRSSFLNSSQGGYDLQERKEGGDKPKQGSRATGGSVFGRMRSGSLVKRSGPGPGPNERPAWEVPFKKLQFEKQIGGGASGQVFRGRYSNLNVAIKQIILGAQEKSLELDLRAVKEEARILWTLRHPQVTIFYGVSLAVRNNMNTLFFVTELCLGSLDCYLEGNRPKGHEDEEEEEEDENDFVMRSRGGVSAEPSLPALTRGLYFKFIKQMAEGMAFMHSKGQ
jgi:hypothetical protein